MSSPAEYYKSLPPITKAYGTTCLLVTIACQIGVINGGQLAMIPYLVFFRFEVWRLITTFFFLGNFSINFGIRLLMIARYGVQLENGPFQRRTADFLWMMLFGAFSILALSAIPFFSSFYLGISLVFMLLYIWSREYPNANIKLYGLVTLKAFYFPWAMLCLDAIFGSPIGPDLLGIIAGHLYYFLTVLHPLAGGKNILKTPILIHKIVARWRIGLQPTAHLSLTELLVGYLGEDLIASADNTTASTAVLYNGNDMNFVAQTSADKALAFEGNHFIFRYEAANIC